MAGITSTATPGAYISAASRLRALPRTFSLEQMCTLQSLSREVGLKYISRWMQAGSVRSAGPRAGFYANLIRAPELAASDDWLAGAMLHVYPTATVIGASVLNAAGWITQHPHAIQVAVLAPANRSAVEGYEATPRARRWYARMGSMVVRPGPGNVRAAGGAPDSSGNGAGADVVPQLPALSPAAALADLFASASAWVPDEDDLEIPPEAAADVARAFDLLKALMPEWMSAHLERLGREGEGADHLGRTHERPRR